MFSNATGRAGGAHPRDNNGDHVEGVPCTRSDL